MTNTRLSNSARLLASWKSSRCFAFILIAACNHDSTDILTTELQIGSQCLKCLLSKEVPFPLEVLRSSLKMIHFFKNCFLHFIYLPPPAGWGLIRCICFCNSHIFRPFTIRIRNVAQNALRYPDIDSRFSSSALIRSSSRKMIRKNIYIITAATIPAKAK